MKVFSAVSAKSASFGKKKASGSGSQPSSSTAYAKSAVYGSAAAPNTNDPDADGYDPNGISGAGPSKFSNAGIPTNNKETKRMIKKEFMSICPFIAVHSRIPVLYASFWTSFREIALASPYFDPPTRELMCVAVSKANHCTLCTQGHSFIASAMGVGKEATLINSNQLSDLPSQEIIDLVKWSMNLADGRPVSLREPGPLATGAGVVFIKHYTNRVCSSMIPGTSLDPFSELALKKSGFGERIVKAILIGKVKIPKTPGESLALLQLSAVSDIPDSAEGLPEKLKFAAGHEPIARALLRLMESINYLVDQFLSPDFKPAFFAAIADWDGTIQGGCRVKKNAPPSEESGEWDQIVDAKVKAAKLENAKYPLEPSLFRFCLQIAMSSHRITRADLKRVRKDCGSAVSDDDLLAVVCFASFWASAYVTSAVVARGAEVGEAAAAAAAAVAAGGEGKAPVREQSQGKKTAA